MNKVQKELDAAFNDLYAIPVRGDYVKLMMSAWEHMGAAYRLAEEKEEEDG